MTREVGLNTLLEVFDRNSNYICTLPSLINETIDDILDSYMDELLSAAKDCENPDVLDSLEEYGCLCDVSCVESLDAVIRGGRLIIVGVKEIQ